MCTGPRRCTVLACLSKCLARFATWILQLLGGVGLVLLCVFAARKPAKLPFADWIRGDHELQVFAAGAVATGLALISGLLGLSTALGAFVAGVLIASARETEWVHRSLEPFRGAFVAVFFLSVGMLLDLPFLGAHWWKVLLLVGAVLLTNNVINAFILRMLGDPWRDSFYAGALLAQVGEFSFVLASVAYQVGLIERYGYLMTIAVIALSLALSPAWIGLMRRATGAVRAREPLLPRKLGQRSTCES